MASSLLQDFTESASASLQRITDQLPLGIQPHVESLLNTARQHLGISSQPELPQTISEQITESLTNLTVPGLFAVLAPLAILIFSMSWWSSSGRYSPFGFYNQRGPPKVTEDDFSYLTADDDRHRHRHDSHSYHHPHEHKSDSYGFGRHDSQSEPVDLEPDVLILKHKGTTYSLRFDAFSIAESLKVGELRRAAAKATNCDDPRRVKLLYKGRSLRNDSAYARDEGLKQNSELICVISSDTPVRNPNDDEFGTESSSSSASSAVIANGVDFIPGSSNDPSERRSKRKNHRGGNKRRNRDDSDASSRYTSTATSQQQPHRDREASLATGSSSTSRLVPPASHSSSSLDPGHAPSAGQFTRDRSPSVVRRAPSPAVAPSTPSKPLTPADTVAAISTKLHTEFLPKVKDLLAHPPPDAKTRAFEAKKLSEGILMQVLFKLDAVETNDEAVKVKRKECVKEANYWSSELDKLGEGGK